MEQSYFQIQLDRAIKEAERLVRMLYAVKTDYADKRMEEAFTKSVTAARISESVTLKTSALPAYTGHPQAEMMVQKALEEAVPVSFSIIPISSFKKKSCCATICSFVCERPVKHSRSLIPTKLSS